MNEAPTQEMSKPGTSKRRPFTSLRRRVRDALHHALPTLVESTFVQDARRWRLEKSDPDYPIPSLPLPGETIKLEYVWAVEFYAPAHVTDLIAAFRRLGWWNEGDTNRDPGEWLLNLRTRGASGYMNLGSAASSGVSGYPLTKRMDLPNGVELATLTLHAVNESLACIVACFSLDEGASWSYDETSRQRLRTKIKPTLNGYEEIAAYHQKDRDIEGLRLRRAADTKAWFRLNFPGAYSKSKPHEQFPLAEFVITTETNAPQTEERRRNVQLQYVGINREIDKWTSDDIQGLRFTLPGSKKQAVAIFHMDRAAVNAFLQSPSSSAGGPPSLHYELGHIAPTIVIQWSLWRLARTYQSRIFALRDDRLLVANTTPSRTLAKRLRQAMSDGFDISALARAWEKKKASDFWIFSDPPSFKRIDTKFGANSLAEDLSSSLAQTISYLHQSESWIREFFMQIGNLASIEENLKIQTSMRVLTWVMLLLTIVTTGVAIYGALTPQYANQNGPSPMLSRSQP